MRKWTLITVLALLWAGPSYAQTSGTLLPNVPGQWFDNNGDPCSACLLYTYAAGTTTPQTTYSDAALATANANPVVLDSAGRATVYLSATNYKVVLKSAAGATIWTRDNVAQIPYTTTAATFNGVCDGRLTLTNATPVTSSDVAAATTVYFTPYKGNRCAIYDGTRWNMLAFSELSIALGSDAADTNYDVFAYDNGGTLSIERLAWTSATARATAILAQDGIPVKSGDTGRRYLGTYRTTSTIGQTEDSATKRFVWNYTHRVPRLLRVAEATNTWTYTTATHRPANNSTANRVEIVVGTEQVDLMLTVIGIASNTDVGVPIVSSIGEDSTSATSSVLIGMRIDTQAANAIIHSQATLRKMPAVGYHYYQWLEYSAATGTTTWYGDGGTPTLMQAGLTGVIYG